MLKKWLYTCNNLIFEYKQPLIIFLVTRVFIISFLFIEHFFYPVSVSGASNFHFHKYFGNNFIEDYFSAYDSQYYLEIAKYGYTNIHDNPGLKIYAYFPLYPIIIKLFSILTLGNLFLAGILASTIFTLLACIYLHKLILLDEHDKGNTTNKRLQYLLLFPTSVFLSAIYTESLYLESN